LPPTGLRVEYLSHDCLIGDDHLDAVTQPIVVDIPGDSAGVLGNLVCTVLDTLNNVVGLVDLLNQLLGLLTGLLGALIPG